MDPTIIVAAIMAGGTIEAQFVIANGNRKAAEDAQKAAMELFDYRIGALEEKVTKHNSVVERLTICEQSAKSAHHRIDRIDNLKEGK